MVFKIIGLKTSSYISSKIISLIGPIFRSKRVVNTNIRTAMPNLSEDETNRIISGMWGNYGRILSEYMFIKRFRESELNYNLKIEGQEFLEEIKNGNEPVIFISGHFKVFKN